MLRFGLLLAVASVALAAPPLQLHPDNPHYFLFRGRPTVLVTSAEHYGAVLNADFDYRKYLDALANDGLNLTRIFTGQYREVPGSFGILRNTLAPTAERFLTPYERSATSGALDGVNKFDLTRWNAAYFARLRDFVRHAGERGIVVEVCLFTTYYEDRLWRLSPLHGGNNVNGLPTVPNTEPLTLKHPAITQAVDAFVRKVVTELREFDNVYYEICNEPYFAGVTLEWQRHVAKVIADAETAFPARHLISQNIANGTQVVQDPTPQVSILNFHYARPPQAVADNYGLRRAIGMNETGFDGTLDFVYRIQAWEFLLAGGALYNNLDYSFTVGQEDGTFPVPGDQPGGGSPALRQQLGTLRRFMEALPLVRMRPDATVTIQGGTARALSEPGTVYAAYVHHGRVMEGFRPRYVVDTRKKTTKVGLDLPAGTWQVEWWNPRTGKVDKREGLTHGGGRATLTSPEHQEDVAVVVSGGAGPVRW